MIDESSFESFSTERTNSLTEEEKRILLHEIENARIVGMPLADEVMNLIPSQYQALFHPVADMREKRLRRNKLIVRLEDELSKDERIWFEIAIKFLEKYTM